LAKNKQMIQRIQTIFLFIAAVAMICMLFFPIWQKVNEEKNEMAIMTAISLKYNQLDANGEMVEKASKDTFYIAILAVISSVVAGFSIFQYKNRLRQIQLGALNSFIVMIAMFTCLYFILKSEAVLAPQLQGTYLIGFYFPVVALLCNLMANRFIRRDEHLVRSADRIR
jgi:ABC-type spermidine/putrescine transport system permease subunit II